MRFFFQRTGAQKFLHILLAGERTIALRGKLTLMSFLRRLHPANGDVGSERAGESPLESGPEIVGQSWDGLIQIAQLLLPAPSVTLFGLRHANENRLAFFVVLSLGQIAIYLRGLDFSAPVFDDNFDCFFLRSLSHCGNTSVA
jgi:hypothetical protein